eukprot:4750438-Prymnesium_polylepis.2
MADGCRVYIGNLDPAMSQDEVDQECHRFGKLSSVWVARNPPGFAFVVSVHCDPPFGPLGRRRVARVPCGPGCHAVRRLRSALARRRSGLRESSRRAGRRERPEWTALGHEHDPRRDREEPGQESTAVCRRRRPGPSTGESRVRHHRLDSPCTQDSPCESLSLSPVVPAAASSTA